MVKKKLKPIEVDRATYKIMEKIWGHKIPYNPTIIKKKDEEDESKIFKENSEA